MTDDERVKIIAEEWRREEPHGSVSSTDRPAKGGTVRRWYARFRARVYTDKKKTYRDTRSKTKAQPQRALLELKRRANDAKTPSSRRVA